MLRVPPRPPPSLTTAVTLSGGSYVAGNAPENSGNDPPKPNDAVRFLRRPLIEQHPGCGKTPLYGPEEGAPPTLCRRHKRAGMFITRDGRTLKSTRDGKGKTAESTIASRSSKCLRGSK